jgi:large subunit ribosomal protein L3
MTQVYDVTGKIQPVTVLKVGPCPVLQIREPERDGYHAVQVGFLDKPRRKATRAERGHVSAALESKRRKARGEAGVAIPPKADCEPQKFVREFRLEEAAAVKVGDVLKVTDIFPGTKQKIKEQDKEKEIETYGNVDVIGTSKGRGTAGVMKRHGFAGLPASHGVKKHHRAPGSVGSHASNRGSGRPKKGKRMAGRYGNSRVTIRNLHVVRVDGQNNLLLVRGAVPGPNGGLVMVRPTNKRD